MDHFESQKNTKAFTITGIVCGALIFLAFIISWTPPMEEMLTEEEGIEVRDVIEKLVNKIEYYPEGMFIADYVQLMQYLMRFMDKNGVEDLKKARWYLDKMIDSYESYV